MELQVMGDYMTSRDLDRANALTGVARQQAEKAERDEAEERSRLNAQRFEADIEELALERVIASEISKQKKAKSKRTPYVKKAK